MKTEKNTKCQKCIDRASGESINSDQMQKLCGACKHLGKLKSPGMEILPVYELPCIADAISDDCPLLGRSGIVSFAASKETKNEYNAIYVVGEPLRKG